MLSDFFFLKKFPPILIYSAIISKSYLIKFNFKKSAFLIWLFFKKSVKVININSKFKCIKVQRWGDIPVIFNGYAECNLHKYCKTWEIDSQMTKKV